MSILDALCQEEAWQEFYDYKKEKAHLSKREERAFFSFIEQKAYLPMAELLRDGKSCFKPPRKLLVNKMDTTKKRVVYSFDETETMLLKLMSYLLYRYNDCFSDNLYSFRRNYGASRAIHKITSVKHLSNMYCYKVDIENYFNSINIDKLLPMLSDMIPEDTRLLCFLTGLLQQDCTYYEGQLLVEKRGVMAGIPIAPFLANVYLNELDALFAQQQIIYARYSDDIICFAETREEIEAYRKVIKDWVIRYDLSINTKKEYFYEPGQAWEFLGICYADGKIDLSRATLDKMKGKIRRKARALYRWKQRKGANDGQTIRAFIRIFNRKFYEGSDSNDLTWARWFFPLITTDTGIKEIDAYLQQYIRYLATGRHSKANYRIDYQMMKEWGYRSLVHEYYQYRIQMNQINGMNKLY